MDNSPVTHANIQPAEPPQPPRFAEWLDERAVCPARRKRIKREPRDMQQALLRQNERAFNLFVSASVLVGVLILLAMLFGRWL